MPYEPTGDIGAVNFIIFGDEDNVVQLLNTSTLIQETGMWLTHNLNRGDPAKVFTLQHVVVLYQAEAGGLLRVSVSTDGGVTFSDPQTFTLEEAVDDALTIQWLNEHGRDIRVLFELPLPPPLPSDLLWVTTDIPGFGWKKHQDRAMSLSTGDLPADWETHYIPGIAGLDLPSPPFHHPNPVEARHPPSYALISDESIRHNLSGVTYDHVNRILTFFQTPYYWAYWQTQYQFTNIDYSDLEYPVITTYKDNEYTDAMWDWFHIQYSNPTIGGNFRYVYCKEDGSPLLVLADFYTSFNVSHDNGATWEGFKTTDEHDQDPGESWLNEYYGSYYHIVGGPKGSDTFAILGQWGIVRSKDLGETAQVVWISKNVAPHGYSAKYPLAAIGTPDNESWALGCNEKRDPDCVWVVICFPHRTEWPEYWPDPPPAGSGAGCVQRNLSETMEPEAWEDTDHAFVSISFQNNLYEDSWVYPDDWPVVPDRGKVFIGIPIPEGLKYFPDSETWWTVKWTEEIAYCNWNETNFMVFSEDDGLTWSNILCDHKNPENWKYMHPFFSPRAWPFSESYQLHLDTNRSGFGFVHDIIQHPSNPDILVTVGRHWWNGDYAIEDPGGRGIIEPFAKPATPEEIEAHPEYAPNLYSLGNPRAVYSISYDRGMTWSPATSLAPSWIEGEVGVWPHNRDTDPHIYSRTPYNPSAYRIFAIGEGVEQPEDKLVILKHHIPYVTERGPDVYRR